MQPSGHVGGALVLVAVAVAVLGDRDAIRVTAIALVASLVPDLDLLLPYVRHQGLLHTYPFMLLVSVGAGTVAALYRFAAGHLTSGDGFPSLWRALWLTAGAFVLGSYSHVTLDLIAYRETFVHPPVEPLWPFTDWVPRVNVFAPNSRLWNTGLLVVGVVAWLTAYLTGR